MHTIHGSVRVMPQRRGLRRLVLRNVTGQETSIDLDAEAAAKLAGELTAKAEGEKA